jgi:glyoxylase-like metal-dependent hydrolase (beta-lactamase superfamily II)
MAVIETFDYRDLKAIRVGQSAARTNTSFIVYRLGSTLIDTGPANQWEYVQTFVQQDPLATVLLTHHHEDHSGNAANILELTGIRAIAHEKALHYMRDGFELSEHQLGFWGQPGQLQTAALPDKLVCDGESVEAIYAPGHADDMLCFLWRDRGWLFSADLYLANRLKVLRHDEHLPTLINSLRDVLSRDFETLICAHRGVVDNGKSALQEKLDFLLQLSADVQALRQKGWEVEAIRQELLGDELPFTLLFSKENLIRSCLDVELQDELKDEL